MTKEELMHRAIELSKNSVKTGGGPFGAVIAKDGIIIAEASNSVTIDLDAYGTCRGELCAPGLFQAEDLQSGGLRDLYLLRAMPDVSGCYLLAISTVSIMPTTERMQPR